MAEERSVMNNMVPQNIADVRLTEKVGHTFVSFNQSLYDFCDLFPMMYETVFKSNDQNL